MVIEPCGVATTFWTFLFPLKRLLGSLLFISRHPSNGAGLLGTPPCLPAPADSPASGSEGPRYSAARSVSMMGGRSRNLECSPLVIQTCLSMPVLVRAWPGRHRPWRTHSSRLTPRIAQPTAETRNPDRALLPRATQLCFSSYFRSVLPTDVA